MQNERDFKGIWIPKEVWLDENLNALEKCILAEIDSLDNNEGCSAGNEYLATFCQCSETKVSTAIKKLIDLGYIYQKSFDGRTRILKSRLSNFERQDFKNLKAELKNLKTINIDINKDNNIKENNIKEKKHKHGEYGNVLLTDTQVDRLKTEYGEEATEHAIKFLDEWIQEKGYKSKEHNLALRRWVFDAINKKALTTALPPTTKGVMRL